jgi:hypothetical protein
MFIVQATAGQVVDRKEHFYSKKRMRRKIEKFPLLARVRLGC